jgi:hypothetical protein
MAEALFLVRRTSQGVNDDRNRVREVVINEDDAQTDAQIIAATVAALNAAQPVSSGGSDVYPAGYFDTVVALTTAVTLGADGDFLAYPPRVAAVNSDD